MVGITSGFLMGVLEPLINKFSSILESQYTQITGNLRDIVFLRDELRIMKTGLEVMSEEEEFNSQGSEWMSQLRELAYDAEDTIDAFMLQPSMLRSNDGLMRTILNKLTNLKAQHRFANDIKELKQRALDISDRRKRYKIDPSTAISNDVSIDPRLPALFEKPENLIGIEIHRDKLVNWITNKDGSCVQCAVLSIVGFGGLGKTTLANEAFKVVKAQFDSTAFVSASRKPNVPSILRHVLMQICKGLQQNNILKELRDPHLGYTNTVSAIRELLQNKRFLIVIDDIWSKEAWQQIRCAFPDNNKASRLLTTTRIEDTATYCSPGSIDMIFHMPPLDSVNSRKLFFRRVFTHEDCPIALKDITDSILKKCNGLPLAIVSIASLLARKRSSKDTWERVLHSLGAAVEQNHELQMVQKILFLSYYDLPSYLKLCFLDLSTYPEDYEIDIKRLKGRWIAEGFVAEQRGQRLEETAQNYVNELINRNMVQPLHIGYRGEAESCRVHDIMLDLTVTLSEQENFATLMDGHKLTPPAKKIRRLSLQGNIDDHTQWPVTHVRSFTAFDSVKLPSLTSFFHLRVLDLQDCSQLDTDYIQNLGSLRQLRYICLRGHNIRKLPSEIGKLSLLRSLDLHATGIEDLPESVGQLERLVCLSVPGRTSLPNIGSMRSLEEISTFGTDASRNSSDIIQQVGHLARLRILWFMWCGDAALDINFKESFVSSLSRLAEIRTIGFQCMEHSSLEFLNSWLPPPHLQEFLVYSLAPNFTRLPPWINFLSELTCLHIFVQELPLEDMRVIEGLPSLASLLIDAVETIKETYTISGFPNLKMFHFCVMIRSGVMGLRFEAGAAPHLEVLNLTFDAKLMISVNGAGFNCGISHLSCLKDLGILINCQDASAGEVEATEAAIRSEAALLPNSLRFRIMKNGM